MELLGTFLAGLGLYFAGIKSIGLHFRQLTSHKLRGVLSHATKNPFRSGTVGLIFGALTQSSVAIMFIVISMVTAGMMDVRRSLPVVTWAAVGPSGLVLLASFDIHVLILYLLGIVGVCYYLNLDEHDRFRHLVGSLLGLSLLFLGLSMVKTGTLPLRDQIWVTEFLSMSASSFPLLFVLGILFGAIVQSSATVAVIAIALTSVGLMTLDQSLMIILGSSIGSGISLMMLTRAMRGTSRQIILTQFWLKLIGILITLPLVLLDSFTPLASIQGALLSSGVDGATSVALVYLFLHLSSAIAAAFCNDQLVQLAERVAPPEPKDELSKPAYISDFALDEPESATDLIEKEIERLVVRLPNYFDTLRPDDRAETFFPAKLLHPASRSVLGESTAFINHLMSTTQSHETLERLLNVQARSDLLKHLQDGCFELEQLLTSPFPEEFTQHLSNQIVEGLHAVLSVLSDTITEQDDPDILLMMSSDRSSLMERVRAGMVNHKTDLSEQSRSRLFSATTLFERVIWLVHRYAKLLERKSRLTQR